MIFTLFLSLFLVIFPQIAEAPVSDFFEGQMSSFELQSETSASFNVQEGGDISVISNFDLSQPLNIPQKKDERSLGIETTAEAAVIMDEDSGFILFEKNYKKQLPIASLTKLMTALVFLDTEPEWEKEVKLQKVDEVEGGIFYARAGEMLRVEDIFNVMLVGSINNVTLALVRSTDLSRDDFVKKMNEKAKELGLEDTNFTDPTGLDPTNVSTAFDIAKLASHAFRQAEIKEAVTKQKYIFQPQNFKKNYYVKNTNELLWSFLNESPYKIIGGKTGYINEAKYCLVLEAENDSHKIISVVLGSGTLNDRFQETKGLTVWAFENYKW